MRTVPYGLSADPSRDPEKFGKWKHRALRLERLLAGGNLNGETEQVQHMLDTTVERLRQLGGVIPSVRCAPLPDTEKPPVAAQHTDWERRDDDGAYAFYSTAGTTGFRPYEASPTVLRGRMTRREVREIADALIAAVHRTLMRQESDNRQIELAESLWERP